MSTPNPEQPVPDALYEAIYNEVFILLRQVVGFAQDKGVVEMYTGRIMAALPAPTPATREDTREDTLLLQWIQDGHNTISWNDRAGGFIVQECQQVCGNIGHGSTLRQALRAAMAHAGEQKT